MDSDIDKAEKELQRLAGACVYWGVGWGVGGTLSYQAGRGGGVCLVKPELLMTVPQHGSVYLWPNWRFGNKHTDQRIEDYHAQYLHGQG